METRTNYYMYVALCNDDTLYTGFTVNVSERIKVHNAGKGAKYTKYRRPIDLLFTKAFETKSEALQAEAQFKKKTRLEKLHYLSQFVADELHDKELLDYLKKYPINEGRSV